MKEKFLNHYSKLGPRRFVVGTVLLLIAMDILSGLYLKLAWIKNNMAEAMILKYTPAEQLADMEPSTLAEVAGLLDQALYFMFFILMINNLFFYFFYLRKKLWAQGYVLFYAFTGSLMSIAFLFDQSGLGFGWLMFNIATIFIYLYLGIGVKVLKNETTLVPEKKGR